MPIIPLEKLIEYKGNRYELSRAMIELAKSGSGLLKNETKYRGGKYIPTVIKNILDGKIKYEYEEGSSMVVDKFAPFKTESATYDETVFKVEEEIVEEFDNEEDDEDDESYEEADEIEVETAIATVEEEKEEVKQTKKAPAKKRATKKTVKK